MSEQRRKQPRTPSGWPRWGTVARFREAAQSALLFPLIRGGYTLEVRGRENLRGVKQPCLIVSNHNMHLDWSMVLRALPRGFRRHTMVAAAATDIFGNRFRAFSGKLLGNAFAFEKDGAGVRESLEQTKGLLDGGWNVLIFPEGKLTVCGPLQPFKSGIGWIAARSEAEIVPMRVDVLRPGLFEGARFPRFRGRVRVSIGKPLVIEHGAAHDESARRLEAAVRGA
ncbi:MAG: lysophospholipid acyltransferase family protein [Tepidiformaceae bacterium]